MKPVTLKESEVLDSKLSMLVPLYPLSKEKFDLLRKNSWDSHSIGSKFLAIFFGFFVKIIAVLCNAIFLASKSEEHILNIKDLSPIDFWAMGIALFTGFLFVLTYSFLRFFP